MSHLTCIVNKRLTGYVAIQCVMHLSHSRSETILHQILPQAEEFIKCCNKYIGKLPCLAPWSSHDFQGFRLVEKSLKMVIGAVIPWVNHWWWFVLWSLWMSFLFAESLEHSTFLEHNKAAWQYIHCNIWWFNVTLFPGLRRNLMKHCLNLVIQQTLCTLSC